MSVDRTVKETTENLVRLATALNTSLISSHIIRNDFDTTATRTFIKDLGISGHSLYRPGAALDHMNQAYTSIRESIGHLDIAIGVLSMISRDLDNVREP